MMGLSRRKIIKQDSVAQIEVKKALGAVQVARELLIALELSVQLQLLKKFGKISLMLASSL